MNKAFSPGGWVTVASGCKSDGARVWFGVHKQLSCQVSLINASCHSQRGSLCPGVFCCCHEVKRFTGFTFGGGVEVTPRPDF